MRPIFLLLALVSLSPLHAADPLPWKVNRVELNVALDYDTKTVSGTERLQLENGSAATAVSVPLNVNRLMSITKVTDAAGRPLHVSQDVSLFSDDPFRQVTHAEIKLPRGVRAGGKSTIVVAWSGHLTGYTETGSLYIRDTVDRDFTILRSDALAYPVVSTLSRATNRAAPMLDFTFDARVTVPDGLTVATGGRLLERTNAGKNSTFHFASDVPVPFLNIAIAPYASIERDAFRIYFFESDRAGAERVAKRVESALELLAKRYGEQKQRPAFSIIEIPEGWGSQAHVVGGIIQEATAFRDAASMQEVYHEISHLWNVPDSDHPSARWNEGLAMYEQSRLAEDLDGWNGMQARVDRVTQRIRAAAAERPELTSVALKSYGVHEITDDSYSVGFLLFAGLERLVGRDTLDQILRDYWQQYRESGGTLAQFEALAVARGGEPVKKFFDDWVETAGAMQKLTRGNSIQQIVDAYRAQ